MPTKSYKFNNIKKKQREKYQRIRWGTVRLEYINSNATLEELGVKYNIPFTTISKKASKEKWTQKRAEKMQVNANKLQEKQLESEGKIIDNIIKQKDELLKKVDNLIELAYTGLMRPRKVINPVTGEEKIEPEPIEDRNLALGLFDKMIRAKQILTGSPTEIIKSDITQTIKSLAMVSLKRMIDEEKDTPEEERLDRIIAKAKSLPEGKEKALICCEIYDSLPKEEEEDLTCQ